MKKSAPLKVQVILPGQGREVEEHSDIIGPAHQRAWRDASRLASPRTYEHDGVHVTVQMDWSVVARQALQKTQAQPKNTGEHEIDRWQAHVDNFIRIPTKVFVQGENSQSSSSTYAQFFVTYHISNVFLAMNIAAPGSANFAGVKVGGELLDTDISFAAYDYDYAWSRSLDGAWPGLKEIPLAQSFDWLSPLERRVVQVGSTPFESVTLSMLQIAQLDSSPSSIIWICCALEALFKTSVGQGFTQLHRRACELLEADGHQDKSLKRKLRSLYDLRSSFVHGGLAVVHPHFSERVDPTVDDQMRRYVDAHLEGVQILLACVQKLVLKGWGDIEFREEMAGVP